METKDAELTSENSMMCEMPNNPDRLMNSDYCQDQCKRIPTSINSNSELMTEAELIQFLRIPEICPGFIYAGRLCTPKKPFWNGWKKKLMSENKTCALV